MSTPKQRETVGHVKRPQQNECTRSFKKSVPTKWPRFLAGGAEENTGHNEEAGAVGRPSLDVVPRCLYSVRESGLSTRVCSERWRRCTAEKTNKQTNKQTFRRTQWTSAGHAVAQTLGQGTSTSRHRKDTPAMMLFFRKYRRMQSPPGVEPRRLRTRFNKVLL